MGFALLIAKDEASSAQIIFGAVISIFLLLTSGILKRKGGYLLGSILQFIVIGYGLVVSLMFYLGVLFAVLWVAAIYLGRKGEAIKAAKIAAIDKQRPN